MSDKLTQLLDELVLNKTFSLDAINAIQSLKTEVENLNRNDKEKSARLKESQAEVSKLFDLLETTKSEVSNLRASLEAAKKETQDLRDLGQQGKEAKAELKGFTEAMQMVFKPSAVRETIQKRTPVPVAGNPGGNAGYGSPGFVVESNESGTVTRSHE